MTFLYGKKKKESVGKGRGQLIRTQDFGVTQRTCFWRLHPRSSGVKVGKVYLLQIKLFFSVKTTLQTKKVFL
jgi:hypothetical protein